MRQVLVAIRVIDGCFIQPLIPYHNNTEVFMRNRINLLNEIGHLAHTPRTGMAFLGTGQQSVAEHCFSVSMICFVLADLCEEPVNLEKLLMLALSHDVAEARTGDLNYMYKRYMKANNEKAYEDLARGSETAT